jgi:hypothetical protein
MSRSRTKSYHQEQSRHDQCDRLQLHVYKVKISLHQATRTTDLMRRLHLQKLGANCPQEKKKKKKTNILSVYLSLAQLFDTIGYFDDSYNKCEMTAVLKHPNQRSHNGIVLALDTFLTARYRAVKKCPFVLTGSLSLSLSLSL